MRLIELFVYMIGKEKRMKKYQFPLAVLMAGMIMRLPFTAVSPILDVIAEHYHVSLASLGMLMTLPLLAFGIFSATSPAIAKKFGLERLIFGLSIMLALGSALRVINLTMLFIGTFIIGIATAYLNVLLPSVLRHFQPKKTSVLTSCYIFAMTLAATVGMVVAAPIVHQIGWQSWVWIITALVVLVACFWLPKYRREPEVLTENPQDVQRDTPKLAVWRNNRAWLILLFSSMQSGMFYTWTAWAPTMAIQNGMSHAIAGICAGVSMVMGLPFALLVPIWLTRMTKKQRLCFVFVFGVMGIVAYAMLLSPISAPAYWISANILSGSSMAGLFPYLMMTIQLKTRTPMETGQLAAMSQSGGYLIAAAFPYCFGETYALCHSWVPQTLVTIVAQLVMVGAAYAFERYKSIF